jgi:tRNA(adenine34) deaminase
MSEALNLAASALSRGEFPVGCILVSGDKIVGSGVRSHTTSHDVNELDHAEICALRDWIEKGCLIGRGNDTSVTAYCNLEPCLMCFGALILNGIKRIVYAYEDVMGGATGLNFSRPMSSRAESVNEPFDIKNRNIYFENRPEILGGVKRKESLLLFKKFFSDPAQSYWKDSLLCDYTMNIILS